MSYSTVVFYQKVTAKHYASGNFHYVRIDIPKSRHGFGRPIMQYTAHALGRCDWL